MFKTTCYRMPLLKCYSAVIKNYFVLNAVGLNIMYFKQRFLKIFKKDNLRIRFDALTFTDFKRHMHLDTSDAITSVFNVWNSPNI